MKESYVCFEIVYMTTDIVHYLPRTENTQSTVSFDNSVQIISIILIFTLHNFFDLYIPQNCLTSYFSCKML